MEFIEKFEKLKKKLDKVDLANLKENFAIQVNMTDDDCGGAFYISYINGKFSVEPYDYYDHTVMITLNASEFEKIIDKKAELENVISEGKILVEGTKEHIKEFLEAFPKAVKKAAPKAASKTTSKKAKTSDKKSPAKKETAKKETAKKETAKKESPKKEEVKEVKSEVSSDVKKK